MWMKVRCPVSTAEFIRALGATEGWTPVWLGIEGKTVILLLLYQSGLDVCHPRGSRITGNMSLWQKQSQKREEFLCKISVGTISGS